MSELYVSINMSVSNRLLQALEHLENDDFENALIQLTIAIDVTSKSLSRPGVSQSQRNKKFIDDNQQFIYQFATAGFLNVTGSINYVTPTGATRTFGDVLYKLIRCGLQHDGILSDYFVFLRGKGIGAVRTPVDKHTNSGFGISKDLLLSLCLVVLCATCNANENFNQEIAYTLYGLTVDLNQYWGDDALLQFYLEQINNY